MRTLRTVVVTTAVAAVIVIPATATATAAAAADSTDHSSPTIGRVADDTPWGP